MFSVLQNATAPVPSPNLQTVIAYNVNYSLLFLVLSGLYMILSDRKVLFSTRIQDLRAAGNIVHYVVIAVVQSVFITLIQSALESWTRFKFFDLGMTLILLAALATENWVISRQP